MTSMAHLLDLTPQSVADLRIPLIISSAFHSHRVCGGVGPARARKSSGFRILLWRWGWSDSSLQPISRTTF